MRRLLLALLLAAPLAAQSPSPGARPPRVTPRDARTPLVVCMTDYGTKGFYVGALHGAIYQVCPSARIETITNEIAEFDIQEGAYTLLLASREYPAGSIFVASVDPGVGTVRKAILVRTRNGYYFVGPDNGILTMVMEEFGVDWVRSVENPKVMRQAGISHTFHGRDVFGPSAASLACGVPPEDFGPLLQTTVKLPLTPVKSTPEEISGGVVMVDHYGGLITNIPARVLEAAGVKPGTTLAMKLGERELAMPFVATYGDVPQGKPLGLISSAGYLELAVNMGNMANFAGAGRNTPVRISLKK